MSETAGTAMAGRVRLLLEFPPSLEAALTEALLRDVGATGFTLVHGHAHAADFAAASTAEQVRGRVQVRVLWMHVPAGEVARVLALLRAQLRGGQVRWWVEPVLEEGVLQ